MSATKRIDGTEHSYNKLAGAEHRRAEKRRAGAAGRREARRMRETLAMVARVLRVEGGER